MHSRILTRIKQLVNIRTDSRALYGSEMSELPCLEDAWLLIEDDEIAGFGKMNNLEQRNPESAGRSDRLQRTTGNSLLV